MAKRRSGTSDERRARRARRRKSLVFLRLDELIGEQLAGSRSQHTRTFLARWARRLARAGLGLLATAALLAVFAVSLVGGVLLHLPLPAPRRLTQELATRLLSSVLRGDFTVGEIRALGTSYVAVDGFEARDPSGASVLRAYDIRVGLDLPATLRSLRAGGAVRIHLTRAHVGRAEVELRDGGGGVPTIAQTFLPVAERTKSESSGRSVTFALDRATIDQLWVRSWLPAAPNAEVTVNSVEGLVRVDDRVVVAVERSPVVLRGLGPSTFSGELSAQLRLPGLMAVGLYGHYGNLHAVARLKLEDGKVVGDVSLPNLEPASVRAVYPAWPVTDTLAVSGALTGSVDDLRARATVSVGDAGQISVTGKVATRRELDASMDVRADALDLSVLVPGAPETELTARARLSFLSSGDVVEAEINGTTAPARVAGVDLPAIDCVAVLRDGEVEGTVTLHEPGLPLRADVRVDRQLRVTTALRTKRFQLERVTRLGRYVAAAGSAELEADAELYGGAVALRWEVTGDGVAVGSADLGSVRSSGTAIGPVSDLRRAGLTGELTLERADLGTVALDVVHLEASGPVAAPRIDGHVTTEAGAEARLAATLHPFSQALEDLRFAVRRGDTAVYGALERASVGSERVAMTGLELSGDLGSATASAEVARDLGAGTLDVDVARLDLSALAELVGARDTTLGGTVSAELHFDVEDERSGALRVAVRDARAAGLEGVSGLLTAEFNGEQVLVDLSGQLRGRGAVGGRANLVVPGRLRDPAAWREAYGTIELQAARVVLPELLAAVGRLSEDVAGALAATPVSVSGDGFARVVATRPRAREWPSVGVEVASRGFALSVSEPGEPPAATAGATATTSGAPLLEVSDVELHLDGQLRGPTGETALSAVLVDVHGPLAAASLALVTPLDRLAEEPAGRLETLLGTSMSALVQLPERRVVDLPGWLLPVRWDGSLSASVRATGTPLTPFVTAQAAARAVRLPEARAPIDVNASAQWGPRARRGDATLEVLAGGRTIALGQLRTGADWWSVLGGAPVPESLQLESTVWFDSVPTRVLPLDDERLEGHVTGRVSVELRQALEGRVQLGSSDLTVAGEPVGHVALSAAVFGGLATVSGELTQPTGRLTVDARAKVADVAGPLPALDVRAPIRVDLVATDVDGSFLAPILSTVADDVGGVLDAELTATARAPGDGVERWDADISGWAEVADGRVQLRGVGMDLREVAARVSVDGRASRTTVTIERLSALSGVKGGKLTADGNLLLDHGGVVGGDVAARMTGFPLVAGGLAVADATGQARIELEGDADELAVRVDVPELTAAVPRSAGRTLIGAELDPTIVVRQPLGREDARVTREGSALLLTVDLGPRVRVEYGDIVIPLTGHQDIVVQGSTEIRGYIKLEQGGRIPALGKVFTVEHGTLVFDGGETLDPHLDISASWAATDAVVFVDIQGKLSDAKLSLRSEPALAEELIWQLLLGGSVDDGADTGTAAQTEAVAGAAAALGFDQLLAGTPLEAVQIRTGAVEGKTQYAASVKVSEKVWVEAIYRTSGSSTSLSDTSRDYSFGGAIDYRFAPSWSLRTEAGTSNAAVDLMWRYRY